MPLDTSKITKIWFSKYPDIWTPILNQARLIHDKINNPTLTIYFIYDKTRLSEKAIVDMNSFCEEFKIIPVDLSDIEKQLPDDNERELLRIAREEIDFCIQNKGGNLAAASDIVRWLTPVMNLGMYADLDVCVKKDFSRQIESEGFFLRLEDVDEDNFLDDEPMIPFEINNDILIFPSANHIVAMRMRSDMLKHYQKYGILIYTRREEAFDEYLEAKKEFNDLVKMYVNNKFGVTADEDLQKWFTMMPAIIDTQCFMEQQWNLFLNPSETVDTSLGYLWNSNQGLKETPELIATKRAVALENYDSTKNKLNKLFKYLVKKEQGVMTDEDFQARFIVSPDIVFAYNVMKGKELHFLDFIETEDYGPGRLRKVLKSVYSSAKQLINETENNIKLLQPYFEETGYTYDMYDASWGVDSGVGLYSAKDQRTQLLIKNYLPIPLTLTIEWLYSYSDPDNVIPISLFDAEAELRESKTKKISKHAIKFAGNEYSKNPPFSFFSYNDREYDQQKIEFLEKFNKANTAQEVLDVLLEHLKSEVSLPTENSFDRYLFGVLFNIIESRNALKKSYANEDRLYLINFLRTWKWVCAIDTKVVPHLALTRKDG